MPRPTAVARLVVGVLAGALLAGCTSGSSHPQALGDAPQGPGPTAVVPASAPRLPALSGPRLRPDVLVTGKLTSHELAAVRSLSRPNALFTVGTVRIRDTVVRVASVDPVTFRRFAAPGTAESTLLWEIVAAGQVVASHAVAQQLHLTLGRSITLRAGKTATLRLGGLATTGIPDTDLLVSTALGEQLGVVSQQAVVLSAGKGDPTALASRAKRAVGDAGSVDLLTQPPQDPTAFLTGGSAARAFGAFSYTVDRDGTLVPDPRWVAANIVTESVPIFGRITCHRLMFPQLRGALQDVVRAGLASKIHTYDGCYVPKFIERSPTHAVSLHTWGIAIDINTATNQRGTRGDMDRRVVQIFKSWGFRWGGDWSWTDPMHFELGALLRSSR